MSSQRKMHEEEEKFIFEGTWGLFVIIMKLLVNTVPNLCWRVILIISTYLTSQFLLFLSPDCNTRKQKRAQSQPPDWSQGLEAGGPLDFKIFNGRELMFVNLSQQLHGHHWWSSLVILLSSQCPSSEAVEMFTGGELMFTYLYRHLHCAAPS